MNLGVADGVDLGWKLAGVLQGWGGDGLLASYEEERRAVHQRTIAAGDRELPDAQRSLVREDLDEDTPEGERAREEVGAAIVAAKTREFKSLGVVLGSHYENSPIIVADGRPRRQRNTRNFSRARARAASPRTPGSTTDPRSTIISASASACCCSPSPAQSAARAIADAAGLRACRSRFSTCARPASHNSMKRRSR